MDEEVTKPVKRTVRPRKTAVSPSIGSSTPVTPVLESPKPSKHVLVFEELFDDVAQRVAHAKEEFVKLHREIEETKENWEKEKRVHQTQIIERNQQEEIARKREQEAYEYETTKRRRQEEDLFTEKKSKWEKELALQKDVIETERKELAELRKQVAGFDAEMQKAIKEATLQLEKKLADQFAAERKLREQEVKAEKELMGLRISTITQENTRQAQEIAAFKKALDEATTQLKDVAVKVIESGANASQKQLGSSDQRMSV